jgi:hypothetical protein
MPSETQHHFCCPAVCFLLHRFSSPLIISAPPLLFPIHPIRCPPLAFVLSSASFQMILLFHKRPPPRPTATGPGDGSTDMSFGLVAAISASAVVLAFAIVFGVVCYSRRSATTDSALMTMTSPFTQEFPAAIDTSGNELDVAGSPKFDGTAFCALSGIGA